MKLPSSTCSICGKGGPKGRHAKCSEQLREQHKNDKRRPIRTIRPQRNRIFDKDHTVTTLTDTDRLDFIIPIISGDDDDDANLRTTAMMGALFGNLAGREAIDHAMRAYNAKKEAL